MRLQVPKLVGIDVWPLPLDPQPTTSPSPVPPLRIARLCDEPAATSLHIPIFAGMVVWPLDVEPQAARVPSLLIASTWAPPAEMFVQNPRVDGTDV